jgi:hypothetical protein
MSALALRLRSEHNDWALANRLRSSGWASGLERLGAQGIYTEEDWTFVTINSVDFRGSSQIPGSSGQYAGVELRQGLICFNAPDGIGRDEQLETLEAALQFIQEQGDEILNKLIEVTLTDEGIEGQIFFLPGVQPE